MTSAHSADDPRRGQDGRTPCPSNPPVWSDQCLARIGRISGTGGTADSDPHTLTRRYGPRYLRGQPALDQMHRGGGLYDATLLLGAGILGADGHNHFRLRGNDFQPLGAIFTNADHVTTPARTDNAVRLNHYFDTFQMVWQITQVALCGFALLARLGHLDGV